MTTHEICAMVIGIKGCEYSQQQLSLLGGKQGYSADTDALVEPLARDAEERQAYANYGSG